MEEPNYGNTNTLLHRKEKEAVFLNEETGKIGIEVDGYIIFYTIEEWYKIGKASFPLEIPPVV